MASFMGEDGGASAMTMDSGNSGAGDDKRKSGKRSGRRRRRQHNNGSDVVGGGARKSRGKSSVDGKWWGNSMEVDPISLEPIAELPYPPFRIKVAKSAGSSGGNSYHLFDGKFLAHYVVSTGTFIDPLSRQPLTRSDCLRLDAYIKEHGLGNVSVADALRLSQAVAKGSAEEDSRGGGSVRAAALQAEAQNVLNAMFQFNSRRNSSEGRGRGRGRDRDRDREGDGGEAEMTLIDRVMTELGGDPDEPRTHEEEFPSLGGNASSRSPPRSRGHSPARAPLSRTRTPSPSDAGTGSLGAPMRAMTLASHLPDSFIVGGEGETAGGTAKPGESKKRGKQKGYYPAATPGFHVGGWSSRVAGSSTGYAPSLGSSNYPPPKDEDLGTIVRRALHENEDAFLQFQVLCSKCAKYEISPEEYYASMDSMMTRTDVNYVLPKLLETLTDKSIVKSIRRIHESYRREHGTAAERLFRSGKGLGSSHQPSPMQWSSSTSVPQVSNAHFPSFPSSQRPGARKPFYSEAKKAVAAGKAAKAAEEARLSALKYPVGGVPKSEDAQKSKKKKKKKKKTGWQKVPIGGGGKSNAPASSGAKGAWGAR